MSPDVSGIPNPEPVGNELLLARALDARVAGSPSGVEGKSLPPELRVELESLVEVVGLIRETTSSVRADEDFRGAARARLLARVRTVVQDGDAAPPGTLPAGSPEGRGPERKLLYFPLRQATPWLAKVAAGFAAVILAGGSTLSASANALPGDALYGVKQASEALTLQLAADDGARARAYLGQAESRLEEVRRLIDQGREDDAAHTANRYDEAWRMAADHATSADQATAILAHLARHQARVAAIIAAAPTTHASQVLERALLTPTHGRERSQEVRQALSEGQLPGKAEQSSVRQGEEPRGANRAGATTPGAVSTASSNQRRGFDEPPGIGSPSSSQAPRGPRDEPRVGPGRATQEDEGAARDEQEQERVRPPAVRAPMTSPQDDRRQTTPRESGVEPRARSGANGTR